MGKRLLSIVLAAVMLLGMCGTTWAAETTGANAASAAVATQAGSTMNNATRIYFNTQYSGSITDSVSENWYKIDLPSAGRLIMNGTSYMKRTSFAIYDADGVRLWYSWDNYWNEQTQSFVIKDYDFDLTRGTYYICFSQSYGYTGRYTFNLKFTSAEESFDEGGNGTNNLLQNANAITLGKTYKGQIALNDEQDFYRFTLPSSGRVTLNGTSYMRRTSLAIYDADGVRLWYSWDNYWNEQTESFTIKNWEFDLTKGTYYICFSKSYSYLGNYNFNLSFTSTGESFAESGNGTNNLLQNANTISLGKRYYGQIAMNDEKDFYRFSVSNACELTLSATAYMKYIYYKIYDADGQQLWSTYANWNSDKECSDNTYSIELKQGGTYYLYVGKYSDYTGNYSFALSSSLGTPTVTLRTNSSTGKPIISWNRVSGATQYEIYRSNTGADGTYARIRITANLSYTDTDARAGSYYYYRVRAINDAGVRGSFSSAKSIRCLSAARLGTPTVTVGASATTGKPVISWSRVSGAAQYEVYRSTSGADGTYGRLCATANLSYTDTSAATGRTYYYRVRAINGSQTGSFSSAKSIRVSAASALAAPSMTLSTDSSTGKPVIRWTKVTGAAQYEVYRSETGKANSYKIVRRTAGLTYTDTAAQTGKTYYYVVRAMRGTVSNPTYSRFCAAKAVKCTLPAPNISIGFSGGQPVISWNKVPGAAQYEVYRSTSGAANTYQIIQRTAKLSYTDTSAVSGTYVYRVRCINSSTGLYSGFSPALSVVR